MPAAAWADKQILAALIYVCALLAAQNQSALVAQVLHSSVQSCLQNHHHKTKCAISFVCQFPVSIHISLYKFTYCSIRF